MRRLVFRAGLSASRCIGTAYPPAFQSKGGPRRYGFMQLVSCQGMLTCSQSSTYATPNAPTVAGMT